MAEIDLDRLEAVASTVADEARPIASRLEFLDSAPAVLSLIAEVRLLRSALADALGHAAAVDAQKDIAGAENASLRADLAEAVETLKDAVEGQEIAEQLADNIRSNGSYSDGSMITFLGQISMGVTTARAIVAKHGGNNG